MNGRCGPAEQGARALHGAIWLCTEASRGPFGAWWSASVGPSGEVRPSRCRWHGLTLEIPEPGLRSREVSHEADVVSTHALVNVTLDHPRM